MPATRACLNAVTAALCLVAMYGCGKPEPEVKTPIQVAERNLFKTGIIRDVIIFRDWNCYPPVKVAAGKEYFECFANIKGSAGYIRYYCGTEPEKVCEDRKPSDEPAPPPQPKKATSS